MLFSLFQQCLQSCVTYKVKSPLRCIFKSRGSAQSRAAVNSNFHIWINTIGWLCSCKDCFTHILREREGRGEKGIGFNDFMALSIPSLPLFFKRNKYVKLETKFTNLSVCIQPSFLSKPVTSSGIQSSKEPHSGCGIKHVGKKKVITLFAVMP